jgi:hypothetical protein
MAPVAGYAGTRATPTATITFPACRAGEVLIGDTDRRIAAPVMLI